MSFFFLAELLFPLTGNYVDANRNEPSILFSKESKTYPAISHPLLLDNEMLVDKDTLSLSNEAVLYAAKYSKNHVHYKTQRKLFAEAYVDIQSCYWNRSHLSKRNMRLSGLIRQESKCLSPSLVTQPRGLPHLELREAHGTLIALLLSR